MHPIGSHERHTLISHNIAKSGEQNTTQCANKESKAGAGGVTNADVPDDSLPPPMGTRIAAASGSVRQVAGASIFAAAVPVGTEVVRPGVG